MRQLARFQTWAEEQRDSLIRSMYKMPGGALRNKVIKHICSEREVVSHHIKLSSSLLTIISNR